LTKEKIDKILLLTKCTKAHGLNSAIYRYTLKVCAETGNLKQNKN